MHEWEALQKAGSPVFYSDSSGYYGNFAVVSFLKETTGGKEFLNHLSDDGLQRCADGGMVWLGSMKLALFIEGNFNNDHPLRVAFDTPFIT